MSTKKRNNRIRPIRLDMFTDEAVILVKVLEGICSNGPEDAIHGRWAARLAFRINRELPEDLRIGCPSARQYYKGDPS
jgi:hypothetical protein